MTVLDPIRFSLPLYSVVDVAWIVGAPTSTIRTWAKGYTRHFRDRASVSGEPVISQVAAAGHREPSIPFVGLAEALVLAAFRKSGVPMQRIRPALLRLQDEIGLDHALASRKLYTDGAEVLVDFGEQATNPEVVADPTRSFGAPIFERGGARVADVLERFWAGETLIEIAEEFGVPVDQLEDVVRVASRRAA